MILYKSEEIIIFWYRGIEIMNYKCDLESGNHGYVSKWFGFWRNGKSDNKTVLYNECIKWLKEETLN